MPLSARPVNLRPKIEPDLDGEKDLLMITVEGDGTMVTVTVMINANMAVSVMT